MWGAGNRRIPKQELMQIVEGHLDRADELQPGMAETYHGRSMLAARKRDDEAAIDYAQKALEIKPNYLDPMTTLQQIYRRQGRYRESEPILKKVLRIDPLSVVGRVNYAELLWETGRCKESHKQADLLIPISPRYGWSMHTWASLLCEGELRDSLEWDLKYEFDGGIGVFMAVHEYAEARRTENDHLRKGESMKQLILWIVAFDSARTVFRRWMTHPMATILHGALTRHCQYTNVCSRQPHRVS
jgi:tetratricopeptide (TPR) repeat protein